MKLKLINYGVLTAALVLVGVSSAHAQVDQVEKVNIPFAFYAEDQKLPAGTYNVGIDVDSDMTTLTSTASGRTVMFLGEPADNLYSETPKLIFDHSGDTYRLHEVQSDELNVAFPTQK